MESATSLGLGFLCAVRFGFANFVLTFFTKNIGTTTSAKKRGQIWASLKGVGSVDLRSTHEDRQHKEGPSEEVHGTDDRSNRHDVALKTRKASRKVNGESDRTRSDAMKQKAHVINSNKTKLII